jgi:hypothetical protein
MAAGVRLHHPTLRNCVYTITNYAVPLVAPMFCAQCSGGPEGASLRTVIHTYKTIHLNIDAVGDVVVHEGIYDLMQRNGLLEELNATREVTPEPMRIGMGEFQQVLTYDREKGILNGQGPRRGD